MRSSIYIRALASAVWLAFLSPGFAWQTASRELVDVQFAANESLIILVSAPGATAPGIYLQRPDAAAPVLLCPLAFPSTFSFDRKTIIERWAGEQNELRLYDPMTCRRRATVGVDGTVIDADVHGGHIAVALQLANGVEPQHELRTYTLKGRMLGRAALGRNVEMGFAPDGRSVLNFDLSDGAVRAWAMPALSPSILPEWVASGETTFVPGSALVKRYADNELTVAQWPGGKRHFSMTAPRSVRVRQLSGTGRFAVLHIQDVAGEGLDWIDFVTAKRTRIAAGSIDNAAISSTGAWIAWASRRGDSVDQVSIHMTRVGAAAGARPRNEPPEARH